MQRNTVERLLLGYYAATFLFLVLDFGLGVNVRLSFLDGAPGWRGGYYALCVACAAIMHWRPDSSVFIGALEGLATMVGLIFGMFLGYTLAGVQSSGELFQVLLNYAISGYFAHLSWSRGLAALSSMS